MTALIEARRLSGVDLGKVVSVHGAGRQLVALGHAEGCVSLIFRDVPPVDLAPSDLVTVTGRGQS